MPLTITDIDGTTPGVAVLVTVDMTSENPNPQWARYVEGQDGCDDPQRSAERLLNGIRDDFPDHEHTIVVNERARYLMAARRTRALLDEDYPAEEYLRDTK